MNRNRLSIFKINSRKSVYNVDAEKKFSEVLGEAFTNLHNKKIEPSKSRFSNTSLEKKIELSQKVLNFLFKTYLSNNIQSDKSQSSRFIEVKTKPSKFKDENKGKIERGILERLKQDIDRQSAEEGMENTIKSRDQIKKSKNGEKNKKKNKLKQLSGSQSRNSSSSLSSKINKGVKQDTKVIPLVEKKRNKGVDFELEYVPKRQPMYARDYSSSNSSMDSSSEESMIVESLNQNEVFKLKVFRQDEEQLAVNRSDGDSSDESNQDQTFKDQNQQKKIPDVEKNSEHQISSQIKLVKHEYGKSNSSYDKLKLRENPKKEQTPPYLSTNKLSSFTDFMEVIVGKNDNNPDQPLTKNQTETRQIAQLSAIDDIESSHQSSDDKKNIQDSVEVQKIEPKKDKKKPTLMFLDQI